MDDGYLVGPREVVLKVMEEFANGVRERAGCELVVKKCKMCIMDVGAWED